MKSIVIEYSRFDVKCNTLVLGFLEAHFWDKIVRKKEGKYFKFSPW